MCLFLVHFYNYEKEKEDTKLTFKKRILKSIIKIKHAGEKRRKYKQVYKTLQRK